jgi:lipoprotein-anchoring transpeptidase ErfK/SrfK
MLKHYFILLFAFLFACKQEPNSNSNKAASAITENNDLIFIGKNNLKFVIKRISKVQSELKSWKVAFKDTSTCELKNITNDSLWFFVYDKLKTLKFEKACNPKLIFDGNDFVFTKQKDGNEINWDKLRPIFLQKLTQPFNTVDLSKTGVYKTARIKDSDSKCAEIISLAKKKSKLKFTFIAEHDRYELTGLDLSKILTTNQNMVLQIDDNLLYRSLSALASKVDRIESPITFIDASNTKRTISKSEIGNRLNIQMMMREIKNYFNTNTSFEKEVIYLMKGVPTTALMNNRDYIEVNIEEQKVYLFKNDSVVLSSDIVTGKNGMSTPKGAFFIKYKETNIYLDGPGYHCYVKYFMPIYKGVGLHDASWRRRFGGNVYISSGSHGCINLPPPVAAFVYNNYQSGAVVICH